MDISTHRHDQYRTLSKYVAFLLYFTCICSYVDASEPSVESSILCSTIRHPSEQIQAVLGGLFQSRIAHASDLDPVVSFSVAVL